MVSNEFQISLSTIEIGVGGKYITTCLSILGINGGNSNIGNHSLYVVDNIIGPTI